ncbi:peptidase domain-containing ABC transporter [Leptolyngbya sp. DQ-M1]|uniref:peptidase domain-containing ABC transporter n=1 Tax=Leptolyngbya sp. DQ-M1 TaxID=2933920 RepID=UPI00329A658A
MIATRVVSQNIIANTFPFNQLSTAILNTLEDKVQLLRYRIGQVILPQGVMPTHISILHAGQVRLLGIDRRTHSPVTLKLLEPGEMLGWISQLRGVTCEMAIASTEAICINLPAQTFWELMQRNPQFAAAIRDRCALAEVFDLLGAELEQRADATTNLLQLAHAAWTDAIVQNLPSGKPCYLDSDRIWFLSSGSLSDYSIGSRIDVTDSTKLRIGHSGARLVGICQTLLSSTPPIEPTTALTLFPQSTEIEIPYAPETVAQAEQSTRLQKYPVAQGRGALDAMLACFQMLSRYFDIPFRRDTLRRIINNQLQQHSNVSLHYCGTIAEFMGLTAQLIKIPAIAIHRVQTPALIAWQDSFAVLYQTSDREVVMAVPETGIVRRKPKSFVEIWGDEGEVLLLRPTKTTPKQRFSLRWFLPAIHQHRKVLIEVLIASIFVQLFGLANPLITQVIIDKVLNQNSIDALSVLGIFLLIISVFESVLTNIRTHLFADTTNRIDLALSTEVIDHLLRLPLSYFEKRPVGELATRVNELEHIRQFLTGTALTVVLDAIFSVIYILVMLVYSWVLTLIALATVPLFALLALVVSPLMRHQSREKAERYAETHSSLVETLSGIQTVKAQNLEMRSRWQWQDRYSRYISAGFKTISTQTTAGSLSNFLNKLSSLLVIWAGAYLVLQGQLTLGQLIAFRIIAGYVTSPLLRLVQLWQNFQETALSIERLSDILDTPQEEELNQQHILMPTIQGHVKFDGVSFGFRTNGALQLRNINLEFPAGSFIGVVGQSGSGKSTLTKLLARLYEPQAGKVVIDRYDISKVELYSLRSQIGMVLQDTLLFDGTVRENIAIANPDATDEQIIEAATIAFAHDFIMELPNGYNTRVGERGSALSGGQRQRIAIARTVLQNPRLLILDEATSALDYNAERQVCLNLAKTFHDRTTFFITHRLSTIRNADIILVMDQGVVIEQGTHNELMSLKGSYYCLYQQQEAQH